MIKPVYRIENFDGKGMFTGLGGVYTCRFFSEDRDVHVGPLNDDLLMRNLRHTERGLDEHLFAVESIHLLENWVQNHETMLWLANNHFRLATYFPLKIVRGNYQCMFLKDGEFGPWPLFKDLRVAAKEFNWFYYGATKEEYE